MKITFFLSYLIKYFFKSLQKRAKKLEIDAAGLAKRSSISVLLNSLFGLSNAHFVE